MRARMTDTHQIPSYLGELKRHAQSRGITYMYIVHVPTNQMLVTVVRVCVLSILPHNSFNFCYHLPFCVYTKFYSHT